MKIKFFNLFLFFNLFIYSETAINFENFKGMASSPISEAYSEYQKLKETNNLKKDEFETNQEFNQRNQEFNQKFMNSKELHNFMNKIYLFNFDDMNMKVSSYNAEGKCWNIEIPSSFKKFNYSGFNDSGIFTTYSSFLYLDKNINFTFLMEPLEAKNNNPLYIQLLYTIKDFSDNSIYQTNDIGKTMTDVSNNGIIMTGQKKETYFTFSENGMKIKVVAVLVWNKNKENLLYYKEFKE